MKASGASVKLFEYIERVPKITHSGRKKPAEFQGRIEFRNVTFSFPNRKNDKVLKNVSFMVEPGQQVALVGPSGSKLKHRWRIFFSSFLIGSNWAEQMKRATLRNHREYVQGRFSRHFFLFKKKISDSIEYWDEQKSLSKSNDDDFDRRCLMWHVLGRQHFLLYLRTFLLYNMHVKRKRQSIDFNNKLVPFVIHQCFSITSASYWWWIKTSKSILFSHPYTSWL